MNGRAKLFWRLLVRPLGREPVRMGLTVLAVALGVAVVLAIDLAGTAATGSVCFFLGKLPWSHQPPNTPPGGVPPENFGPIAAPSKKLPPFPRHGGLAGV